MPSVVKPRMNALSREAVGLFSSAVIALSSAAQVQLGGGPVAGIRASIPMCKAGDLSLGTDSENGSFNGMSHSGTLLVLRNLSSMACRVPARPEIGFVGVSTPGDAKGDGSTPSRSGSSATGKATPLPIRREIPGGRFMHPGPVIIPVVVAPGAELTSKLRWVSGEVFDSNLCFNPTAITVKIEGEVKQAAFAAHICGDKAEGVTFEATPLAPDPQFTD